ncbi:glycine cleavage system aminomethyltransferase GcvT [Paraperlucidibaca wandonensis]|uniref:Aminomethyltransferase n=1 Tax=Paraperlucidibaca wandonensis TaxID=1268273 RepID=A0ABW3HGK4_9GAMM
MGQRTSLYQAHVALGARLVDFGGWDMPVQYSSVIDEHHAVRRDQGMFDVSHMTFIDLTGPDAVAYLQKLLANNVAKLKLPGKAIYSVMLNDAGCVLDDLIVYAPTPEQPELWRVIVNCGTHDKDIAWMQRQAASFRISLKERTDLAMIAVQGPNARATVERLLGEARAQRIAELALFQGVDLGDDWFVARTGYTGEDGLEIMLPNEQSGAFWQQLLDAGVAPCGLGARDTLRLEAGMPLYGNDLSENESPLSSCVAWSIDWAHDFIGKDALVAERDAGVTHQLVGLVLEGKGVLRSHMRVIIEGVADGETTSGTFSPTLQQSIAFARIPLTDATQAHVDVRGKLLPVRIVKPMFVRRGAAIV